MTDEDATEAARGAEGERGAHTALASCEDQLELGEAWRPRTSVNLKALVKRGLGAFDDDGARHSKVEEEGADAPVADAGGWRDGPLPDLEELFLLSGRFSRRFAFALSDCGDSEPALLAAG